MLFLNTCFIIMFSCYRTSKWLKRCFCTYAPRLDISLKKILRPSHLHTTYLSRYSMRCYSQTKYFPNGSLFFLIYKLVNTPFLEVCKFEKILPVGTRLDISLKKNHDLQICTRPTCHGIVCEGIRKKKNSKRKYFFPNLQTYKKRCI